MRVVKGRGAVLCHSPLTGIFLIRRRLQCKQPHADTESQSPDGDFFDPERASRGTYGWFGRWSQSPDGDFFDPENTITIDGTARMIKSQSPDGDFFDPEEIIVL